MSLSSIHISRVRRILALQRLFPHLARSYPASSKLASTREIVFQPNRFSVTQPLHSPVKQKNNYQDPRSGGSYADQS